MKILFIIIFKQKEIGYNLGDTNQIWEYLTEVQKNH